MSLNIKLVVKAVTQAGDKLRFAFHDMARVSPTLPLRQRYLEKLKELMLYDICESIKASYPQHALPGATVEPEFNDYVWSFEPLDGDSNFLAGLPHFACVLSIMKKGVVEQSVIYDPIRDEVFSAMRGMSAQLNNNRIRLSKSGDLTQTLLATTHLTQQAVQLAEKGQLRFSGCSALDLAYVASGRISIFHGRDISPTLVEAGQLLVQEAGGFACNDKGQDYDLSKAERNLIVGHGKLFSAFVKNMAHAKA